MFKLASNLAERKNAMANLGQTTVCNSTEHAICKNAALVSLHNNENACKEDKDKLSIIQEYSVKELRKFSWSQGKWIGFELAIIAPDAPDQGLRLNKPFKKVFSETPVIDQSQLVGTIGGTLGMMIGFSFLTCIEWATKILTFVSLKMRKIISGTTKHWALRYK